jgi:subtilase family serine protease
MARRRRLLAVGTTIALVGAMASAGGASAAPRRGGHWGYVAIPNSSYTLQDGDVDLGVFPSDPTRFAIAMKPRNEAGAESVAAAVSDPSNPAYGHYLTPAQYRRFFSPTDLQASIVSGFMRLNGFTISYDPANHVMIVADGSVAKADRAFQTDIHRIQLADGSVYPLPLSPLYVPASAYTLVAGLAEGPNAPGSLFRAKHVHGDSSDTKATMTATVAPADAVPTVTSAAPPPDVFVPGTPCSSYWAEKTATATPPLTPTPPQIPAYITPIPLAPCGYKPAQLTGAYGETGLLAKGIDGTSITVAITDAYAAPTIEADINQFANSNGGAPWDGKFSQIVPASTRYGYDDTTYGDDCGEQGWYGEETLDVEGVHTMAPGANVLYVGAQSCQDDDLLGAVNDVVDGHLADIVTNSWGGVNEDISPALLTVYNAVFVQAAATGIGVFFSSGDNGDETGADGQGARTVDFPASDPWVTAVGGTSLAVGQDNGYLFETGWGNATDKPNADNSGWTAPLPGVHTSGAGGGTSRLFPEPSYQKGVVPASIARYWKGQPDSAVPGRAVPDIAALADPSTGMLVGETQTFPDGTARYSEYRIGGTSVASPLMAGMEAVADQAAGFKHGFANPAIYALKAKAVHDVVTPSQTLAVWRADYANGVDASEGTVFSLRTLDQTQTISTRPGYDDVTGVGTPIMSVYAKQLGKR